jgi:CHRD domain-containing protein
MRFRRLLSAAAVLTALSAAGLLGFTAVASAQSEWVTLSVSGSGEEEVPAGSGEDGAKVTGSFQISAEGEFNYTVSVTGNSEEITAGHIHRGAKGENGDLVVELDADAINARESATVEIEQDLAKRIIDNPGNWYLNIHSESFQSPKGVARGQLTGNPDEPEMINTGTGGQAADQGWAGITITVLGALVFLASSGALIAARRRTDRPR